MATAAATAGSGKSSDFYGVLGVEKECTIQEMRIAYKRLSLRWHPDRCSGNAKSVEEAKKKFQGIQQAYSVLSDFNKRFSYDVGMYQNDDGDDNDMGEFLSKMASMMNKTKPCENERESLEQLQGLFNEIFQDDINLVSSSPFIFSSTSSSCSSSNSSSYPSSFKNYDNNLNSTRKRHSADFAHSNTNSFNTRFQNLHCEPGNTSSSSSCNSGRIKRRNSGSNYH